MIYADRNMIKTILRNLISNSIKFTHRNGRVEIKAFIAGSFTQIEVTDNGIGMPKEIIEKLFRIDANIVAYGTENEKGTGLGLFICKDFTERHGGKIWAESEEGNGSSFKFILPLKNRDSA
jgi:signal transduction histidine kinase